MIHVIAAIHIKPGRTEEFLEIFKANVPMVLQEAGCLEYVPTVDLPAGLPLQELDEQVVTILEKWRSPEDLRAHLAAPHMLAYRAAVREIVERVSLKILVAAD